MNSVRDILEAIRALPRPDRLRLAEELHQQLQAESAPAQDPVLPEGSQLELRDGFYVHKGPIAHDAVDHRLAREDRVDRLIGRIDARRG
jgi:hypothetical protein